MSTRRFRTSESPFQQVEEDKIHGKRWNLNLKWILAMTTFAGVVWAATVRVKRPKNSLQRILARPRIERDVANDTRLLLILSKPRVVKEWHVVPLGRRVDLPPSEGKLSSKLMYELYNWFTLPPYDLNSEDLPEEYEIALAETMPWPRFVKSPDPFIEFSSDYNLIKPLLLQSSGNCRIAVISTFPPKHCGIAQFTNSILKGLQHDEKNCSIHVLPLIELGTERLYLNLTLPERVQIPALIPQSFQGIDSQAYLDLARYIRLQEYDSVLVQQEFGLTRSMWQIWLALKTIKLGDFYTTSSMFRRERTELAKMAAVANWKHKYNWKRARGLDFLKRAWKEASLPYHSDIQLGKVPRIAVVVHSPRAFPNPEEQCLIYALSQYSDVMITMTKWGIESLQSAYGVSPEKLVFLPHGIDMTMSDMNLERYKIAPRGKQYFTLFANGLITKFKRYDRIISAMPRILSKMPKNLELRFIILGQTCEDCLEQTHVAEWKRLAKELQVEQHVVWMERFASKNEIRNWLSISDVFIATFDEITPVSGTLLEAMSVGVPILATWTRFAVEMMQGLYKSNVTGYKTTPVGTLVPFDDARSVSRAVLELMQADRLEMGRLAREKVIDWTWEKVASSMLSHALGQVPLEKITQQQREDPDLAYWSGESMRFFNGKKVMVNAVDSKLPLEEYYAAAKRGQVLLKPGTFSLFATPRIEVIASFVRLENAESMVYDGEDGLRVVEPYPGVTVQEIEVESARKRIKSSIVISNVTVNVAGFHIDCDAKFGCDALPSGKRANDAFVQVFVEEEPEQTSYMRLIVSIEKINVTIAQTILSHSRELYHGLSVKITVQDAYAYPVGILGQTLRCNHDYSCQTPHLWRSQACPVDCGFEHAGAPYEFEDYLARTMHGEAFEDRLRERAEAMQYNAGVPRKSMWIPVPPELPRILREKISVYDVVESPLEFLWTKNTATKTARGQSARIKPICNVYHHA
jgi:glycosyltransferase involved in cell wall biosynthesis